MATNSCRGCFVCDKTRVIYQHRADMRCGDVVDMDRAIVVTPALRRWVGPERVGMEPILGPDWMGRRPLTPEEKADAWERTTGRCAYCGLPLNPFRDACIDHVLALRRGGTNAPQNLLPACRDCNMAKGIRTLAEWRMPGERFWFERNPDMVDPGTLGHPCSIFQDGYRVSGEPWRLSLHPCRPGGWVEWCGKSSVVDRVVEFLEQLR